MANGFDGLLRAVEGAWAENQPPKNWKYLQMLNHQEDVLGGLADADSSVSYPKGAIEFYPEMNIMKGKSPDQILALMHHVSPQGEIDFTRPKPLADDFLAYMDLKDALGTLSSPVGETSESQRAIMGLDNAYSNPEGYRKMRAIRPKGY
jgi:hypothetical protein